MVSFPYLLRAIWLFNISHILWILCILWRFKELRNFLQPKPTRFRNMGRNTWNVKVIPYVSYKCFISDFISKAVFVLASNHIWKCFSVNAGVWLHMENKCFGNYFQLTVCFEGFDSEMVWSENFHFKPFPNSCTKTERERESLWLRLRLRWSTNPLIYELIKPLTLPIYEPTLPIFDPKPSTHEPLTSSTTQSLRAMNISST